MKTILILVKFNQRVIAISFLAIFNRIPLLTERKGMFKIFKNTAVCVLLVAIILTGCSTKVKDSVGNVTVANDWFYRIGDTPMVYDKEVHTSCIICSEKVQATQATAICLLIIISTVRCATTLMVRLFLSRRC